MLDLAVYRKTRPRNRPIIQRMIAEGFLRFDFRNVQIDLEGIEKLPPEPVIYAMNHTDSFNYWPFQYGLYREKGRYTATWVKGKNYEHPFVRGFMRATNNIPLASRGYLIARDFLAVTGRKPSAEEYRTLRDAVDGVLPVSPDREFQAVMGTPRDMFGRTFDPQAESYAEAIRAVHREMMSAFVELNRKAVAAGLDLLVFPQGTRSTRLCAGRPGIVHVALALGLKVVPVGCNGSDRVYAGNTIFSGAGRIVYRMGEPMDLCSQVDRDALAKFVPFAPDASLPEETLQRMVDEVMERINALLDERYQFSEDRTSDGHQGIDRFL